MEEMRIYSGVLGMERNKRAGHSMEMKPEARVTCQVMLAVLFTALFITAIAFAVQAFQPHPQPCFQCPFDWIRYRGKCYYFSEVEGNWTSSQDNCSALDASLAMLDSMEDLSFVMRYKGISEHWIGLLREDEEQPWQWVNRSPLSHLRAAWPRQLHKTLVPTLARASSLAVEETKTPQEAMGEPPQAVVIKTFGGLDETCEEKILSHLQSLRKMLAESEFLYWRVSEEKRHQDYLVQGVPSVLQQSE
ncbi:C-type lectin domain family 2 member D6 isoform X1 [Lonchura striata]